MLIEFDWLLMFLFVCIDGFVVFEKLNMEGIDVIDGVVFIVCICSENEVIEIMKDVYDGDE